MAHNKRLLLNSRAALFAKILSGPDKGFFILEHYSVRLKKKQKKKQKGLIDGEKDDNSAVIMVVILPSSLTHITSFPFFLRRKKYYSGPKSLFI